MLLAVLNRREVGLSGCANVYMWYLESCRLHVNVVVPDALTPDPAAGLRLMT
jgi:hypothetical protein